MSGGFAVREGLDETGKVSAGQAAGRQPPARAVPAAIEVSHLTKVFGGRTAVSDVSFSVASGKVFGFLGPNGAGKTTTVRILAALRDRGVTVFLTTHRLEEAERLCDRVAIMSTSLRTIGRPEDLRAELFAASLEVTVAAVLPEPGRVFGGLPAVQGWKPAGPAGGGPAGYVLTVTDPALAAPAVTRALVAAGADVLSIARSRHTLEDVYLELVAGTQGSPR